jgi:hypothetical protein
MFEDTGPAGFSFDTDALGPVPAPRARPAALLSLHLVLLGSVSSDRPGRGRPDPQHPGLTGAAHVLEHDVRTGRFRLGAEQYDRLRHAGDPHRHTDGPTASAPHDGMRERTAITDSPITADASTVDSWAGHPWHQTLLYLVTCMLADFTGARDEYLAWLMANGHLAANGMAPLPPLPMTDPDFEQALTTALLTRDATELLRELRALSPIRPRPSDVAPAPLGTAA